MKLLFAAALLFGLSAYPVMAADTDQESGMGAAHEHGQDNHASEKGQEHMQKGKDHMDHGKDKAKGHNEEGMGHGTEHKDMDKDKDHKGKGHPDKE